MTSLTIAAVLQLSLAASGEKSYAEAYRQNAETGKPLVVLIGADWCPACQTMKHSVIPQAKQQGVLDQVAFATINTDHEPALAGKLMSQNSIPQLLVYSKTAGRWQRKELIGAQSLTTVEAAIKQALLAAPRTMPASNKTPSTEP